MKMTLPIAQQIVRVLNYELAREGWTVSLYGSTLLQGEGRDLDLIIINKIPKTDETEAVYLMEKALAGLVEMNRHEGNIAKSFVFKYQNEFLIDVVIYIVEEYRNNPRRMHNAEMEFNKSIKENRKL